ncbi:hypothetical protein Pmani_023262 [Petrolisthes manimaculis]|uniref:C2H2-type domain-containing protein n=1 Tax=Petrolisthes manimaculis TaxID=1843537 RepID=A0AAE1PCB0_9EUCA|nr:hypothetical protein Pmani_023262 [Petrolisthes manimaculis]
MVLKAQLRWTGHVIRMESSRLPLQLLYGDLRQGQRPRGRPKKRFKDCIKDSLKYSGTPATELECLAQDRSAWHSRTSKAQEVFETNRRDQLANAREAHKAAKSSLSATAAFQCPYCPRVCASRIGLSSHTRAHERRLSAR